MAEMKVGVITGSHFFDVPNFHKLFRRFDGMDVYIQNMEDFATSSKENRQYYDVLVFYHMIMQTPVEGDCFHAAINEFGTTDQGLLVLHHSILAYPEWSIWNEIVGVEKRGFEFFDGQDIHIDVANPDHPITERISGWEMVDETYTMDEPGEGSQVLLTADHPNSMKSIAWTRQYKNSRVFCFQSGHDNKTWENPSFAEVLERGIQWCAGGR